MTRLLVEVALQGLQFKLLEVVSRCFRLAAHCSPCKMAAQSCDVELLLPRSSPSWLTECRSLTERQLLVVLGKSCSEPSPNPLKTQA